MGTSLSLATATSPPLAAPNGSCAWTGTACAKFWMRKIASRISHGVCEILDAILRMFPLDTYVAAPVALMQVSPGDDYKPEIWPEYRRIVLEREGDHRFEEIERFAFYERAKKAYAIIATGESALYANVILKKGVVKDA